MDLSWNGNDVSFPISIPNPIAAQHSSSVVPTYSARKPRGLGAPVSPAPIVDAADVKDRRIAGEDVMRRGRTSAECMVGNGGVEGEVGNGDEVE